MDMETIKYEIDTVMEGIDGTNREFVELIKPIMPKLMRGTPDTYMSAINLVVLADEIVLRLYDTDTLMDFSNFLETLADSTKRHALTKMAINDTASNDVT